MALEGRLPDLASLLTEEVFRLAWERMVARGGAGLRRDDEFAVFAHPGGRAWLLDQVRGGRWQPRPLRHVTIEKPSGGARALGIPSVADRLVQAAVHHVLSSAAEPLLLPHVHGFRPGRGPTSGVRSLLARIGVRPWLEVVKGDVHALFDRLEHRRLLSAAGALCPDPLWLRLNAAWLRAWTDPRTPGRGIPQGAPLSPLLANLYLHGWVDGPMERERGPDGRPPAGWLRYADDFLLVGDHPGCADVLLRWLDGHLGDARLRLAPHKTEVRRAGDRGGPLVVLGVPLRIRPEPGGFRLERVPIPTGGGGSPARASSAAWPLPAWWPDWLPRPP